MKTIVSECLNCHNTDSINVFSGLCESCEPKEQIIKCNHCGNNRLNFCSKELVLVLKDEEGEIRNHKLLGIADEYEYWCTGCGRMVDPEEGEEE